jgi:hypothetical protein
VLRALEVRFLARDGWRFDYEGMQDDASEAMSILQKSM